MATSFKITDGTTEYELFYNAASQTTYKQLYGAQLQGVQPNVLMHQPDFDSAVPVRGFNPNRQLYLNLHVPADTTWDGVYDAVTDINRMVDGRDSQALRYWTDGDVNRVVIRVQQDAATNYTDIPVLYGSVNIDTAYFNPTAELNKWALGVVIALSISPHGEGAAITLRNDLASSPHMIEDSDSNGTCDGVTAVGTPTLAINTNRWLTGGQSQECTTDASTTEGFRSANVTASVGTNFVIMVDISSTGAGNDPISIQAANGSGGQISEKEFDPASPTGYDKTWTDQGGFTWYRYSIAHSVLVAANCRIEVKRKSTDATQNTFFAVDKWYLEIDQTVVPDAWCSTSAIENRHDASSSNESRINYVDVWGVLGDVDPLIDIKITPTTATINQYYISKHEIGKRLYGNHWFSSASASASDVDLYWYDVGVSNPDGTPSVVTDATRYSGEYLRLTADASPATDQLIVPLVRSTSEADQKAELWRFLSCAHRIFMVARSSSTSTTFELSTNETVDLWSLRSSGSFSPTAASTWELYDLGFMSKGRNIDNLETYFSTATSFEPSIRVDVLPGASGATVDVDAVFFLPQTSENPFLISNLTSPFSTVVGDSYLFANGEIYMDTDKYETVGERSGGIKTVQNGNKETRLVFFTAKDTLSSGIDVPVTATMATELTLTPRTRHLLGVK